MKHGFNITKGNQRLIITKMDKAKLYFSGYIFGFPNWSTAYGDAVIFQNGNQADDFSRAYGGQIEIY